MPVLHLWDLTSPVKQNLTFFLKSISGLKSQNGKSGKSVSCGKKIMERALFNNVSTCKHIGQKIGWNVTVALNVQQNVLNCQKNDI